MCYAQRQQKVFNADFVEIYYLKKNGVTFFN